jgi:protein-tyrosine phosphatase
MIDLHTHVLPGVDDGPPTIDESLGILADSAASGVRMVAATPHVRDDYPTTASVMEGLVAALRREAGANGIAVEVLTGGEIALDRLSVTPTAELRRFGLGGNSRYLLVEFPYYGWPLNLAEELASLRSAGFAVMLAHPERNAEVQAAPGRLAPLVDDGTLVQLTAASFSGTLGRRCRATALRLLELGLAHVVASDAHARGARMGLAALRKEISDERLAQWLTADVPRAIVTDEVVPTRPTRKRSLRWAWTAR